MRVRPPSEARLKATERDLRKASPRAQRAVGGGIYMRLDASGRRRFQFRTRGGGSHAAGTFDSWIEAVAARDERGAALAESAELGTLDSASDLRRMTVKQYAPLWWKHVLNDCEVLTQVDYRYGLGMALIVAGDFTLEQLDGAPLLVDEIKTRLRKLKTRPKNATHRPGEFTKAAADKGLKALSNICTHAVDAGAMTRNPFDGIHYFNNTRGANGKKSNGHRAIKVSEVQHPGLIAEIGLGMRGSIATIEQDRLVAELIAFGGLRPQVICAMRHRWWRDANGPRAHLLIEEAVKDVRGHLMLGEPKTGKYEPVIWPAIAEQLERVYQAQGCPSLDDLVVPNEDGNLLDWGNWRRRWYRALFTAGIAKENDSSAEGAFAPYLCRHIGVVTMLHAQRPAAIGGGNYSRYEVAKHHGHTVETLDKVYAGIPQDLLGIAGLTMDEIVRAGRRHAWGPIPGDHDYEEILYTTVEASALTGLSVSSLGNRARLGNLPARRQGNRYLISCRDTLAERRPHPDFDEKAAWACVARALRHDQWSCSTGARPYFVRGLSAQRANVAQAVTTAETLHQDSRRHRALGDATRRSLLEALDRTTEPLDARTLAELVGLHVNTVRWHLDILVEAGIVAREATEAAGRGRPPYGYRLSTGTLIDGPEGVSFLTHVLADVVARTDPEIGATVEQAGRVRGRALVRPRIGAKGADTEEAVGVVVQLLERLGFDPRVQRVRRGRRIAMRPCPFGELAAEHPSVVCRAHLGLMRGVLDTLRSPIEATTLEPFVKPNLCLVHLELPPEASAGKPPGDDRSLASSSTAGEG